jgi:6-phosphogluconate dehydrogenase (decarboxylating)
MKLGMVGLGRMGGNMTVRLQQHGHEVVAFDPSADAVERAVVSGAEGASSLAELCSKLPSPKVVWLMVPSGDVTEATVRELGGILGNGDVIVAIDNQKIDSVRTLIGQLKGKTEGSVAIKIVRNHAEQTISVTLEKLEPAIPHRSQL